MACHTHPWVDASKTSSNSIFKSLQKRQIRLLVKGSLRDSTHDKCAQDFWGYSSLIFSKDRHLLNHLKTQGIGNLTFQTDDNEDNCMTEVHYNDMLLNNSNHFSKLWIISVGWKIVFQKQRQLLKIIKDFRWIRNDFISTNFECLQICFKKSIKGLHFSVEGITKIWERILVREKQVGFPSESLVLRKLKALKVFKLASKIVSYSSFKVLVNFIFVNEIFNFKFNSTLVFTVHHIHLLFHLLFLKVWVIYRSFVKVIWVLSETIVTPLDLTGRFLQNSNRFSNLRRIVFFIFCSWCKL